MRKLFFVAALLALLAVPTMTALAWNGGVSATKTCDAVTVTASPENPYWEDHSFPNYVKWVVTGVGGTGVFPFTSEGQTLSGNVGVTWQKYTSYAGIFWSAQNQFHTQLYPWSKTRSAECPSFYDVCDETVALAPVVTYGEWSAWAFNPDTGLFERSRTKTTTTVYVDARDGQTPCGDPLVVETEDQETRDPDSRVSLTADCVGVYAQVINEGDAPDGPKELIHEWANPFVVETFEELVEPTDCEQASPESYMTCEGVFEFDDETQAYELTHVWTKQYEQEVWGDFVEPRECVDCEPIVIGRWFIHHSADGIVRELASFSPSDVNPSGFYPPSVGAQLRCNGFVSVDTDAGELIYRNCDGTTEAVCYRCMGGGPNDVYKD